MNIVKSILATLSVISFILSANAAEDGPTYLTVLQVRVNPGMQPQYEQAVHRFKEANDKLKTDFYWSSSTGQFGPAGLYTFARFHTSLATVQANPRNIIAEAFGDEAAREQIATIAATTAESRNGLWLQRPDLSVMPPQDMNAVNLSFLQVTIKPFGNAAYEEYLAKVVEANRATYPEGYYITFAPGWGAENVYAFVSPLPNLGELGPPPVSIPERLVKHFGKREANRLLEVRDSLVVAQQTGLSNTRSDLSRMPQQ